MTFRGGARIVLACVAVTAGLAVCWGFGARYLAEAAAGRLRQETGRSWQIGGVGLGLDGGPHLVLRELVSAPSLRIREVRLADPLGFAFGWSPVLRVRADDIALRLPTTLGPSMPAVPLPRRVKAVARGTDARIEDSEGMLALSADTLELTIDPGPAAHGEISFAAETGAGLLTAELGHPDGATGNHPLRIRLDPLAGWPRLDARAQLQTGSETLKLDGIAGTLGGSPLAGTFSATQPDPAAKPRIALDLRCADIAVTDGSENAGASRSLVVPARWDLLPEPAWLARFEGTAALALDRLTLGPVRVKAVRLTATVRDGALDAALVTASGYGGGLRGRYVLTAPPNRAQQLGLSLHRVRMLPLLDAVAGIRGLDGTGTARIDLQAPLGSGDAVLRGASGHAEVSVEQAQMNGPWPGDFGALAGPLAGALRVDRLAGRFTVEAGRATTDDLSIGGGSFAAQGAGTVDLAGQSLDLMLRPQRVARDGRTRPLGVPVRIEGPWQAPAITADLSGLARDPVGALQDLGATLLGEPGLLKGILSTPSGPGLRHVPGRDESFGASARPRTR